MVQGKGERGLLHPAVARQQRDEPALGPVVHVAGRVAEVAPVGAARHVQPAPERLARDRDEQVAARHARHLRQRRLRLRHVLQHLDGGGEVELAVGERERVASSARNSRLGRSRFAHSARSLGSSRSIPTTRPSPSCFAHSSVSTPSPQPTSSTDDGPARSRARRASRGSRHQPLHDRVARPVLVEGVPGGDLGDRGAAHVFAASRSSVLPVARPDCAPVVAACPVSEAPGS